MNVQRLEGFYYVALHRGYAEAARRFPYPITQPGVYQQVRKLQDELEVQLFERLADRSVCLTPAGQKLFDFCAPFFEGMPQLTRSLVAEDHGGTLRVQSVSLLMRTVLPAWTVAAQNAHENLRIDLVEQVDSDIERIRLGKEDLLIDYVPQTPKWAVRKVVGMTYAFLVLPAGHPAIGGRSPKWKLLKDVPFVSYAEGSSHAALQMAALSNFGLSPSRYFRAGSVDSILAMVTAGLGYSFVPWPDQQALSSESIASWRVPGDRSCFPIHALWRSGYDNPLIEAFLSSKPSAA